MKEARYYTALDDDVRCELCPHHCRLAPGKRGICLTRQNIDGLLVTQNYCSPVTIAVDPIEKKPLYHFHPGSSILSAGPNGCTFKCTFCQNCEISQEILSTRVYSPGEFIRLIVNSGTLGIAYTYSEPYIWFETIMDVGREVREHGMKNVMVTNGFTEPEPLEELLTVVDAMNIDIKSIEPHFYRHLCKGTLDPVLRTCEAVKKRCHLEITNLLVTGENDTEKDIEKLCDYIATNLGKETPLHLSRYFPRHQMTHPATPEAILLQACEIARTRLDFVYPGNMAAGDNAHTICPSCGVTLVGRFGHTTEISDALGQSDDGRAGASCRRCGTLINIIC